jgi:CheY-like chemotaxis protein
VGAKHLGRLGLEVETAAFGAQAVDRFRRARAEGRPFDLVVLDVTASGGMGGAQALKRVQETARHSRCIRGNQDRPRHPLSVAYR